MTGIGRQPSVRPTEKRTFKKKLIAAAERLGERVSAGPNAVNGKGSALPRGLVARDVAQR
jgi:hypothetical protein